MVCKGTSGENTTSMTISNNGSHLITTTQDGNILFWALADTFQKAYLQRVKELGLKFRKSLYDPIKDIYLPEIVEEMIEKPLPPKS